MKSPESKSQARSLLELAITVAIIFVFLLFTLVVIMLVTGALHVLNRNFLQLSFINIISAVAAVIILFLSASFFVRAFKSIRISVIKAILHDHST